MHPILIKIGPLTIYSYGFFVAAAILLALIITVREAKIRQLNHKIVSDLAFYLIISAIVGSRLLYVLFKPDFFLNNPLKILEFWKGGLVFAGGAVAAILVGWYYLHKKQQSFWAWADAFAPGIAAGQALGRVGCLMAGCCYGKPTNLPWAITFTNPDSLATLFVPLHPTQIYHSLAGLITLLILLLLRNKLGISGLLFALLLLLYSSFRFFIEFFRGDFRMFLGALSLTQWMAIGIFISGALIYYLRRRT